MVAGRIHIVLRLRPSQKKHSLRREGQQIPRSDLESQIDHVF